MEGSPKAFGAVVHDLSEIRRLKNEQNAGEPSRLPELRDVRVQNRAVGGAVIDAANRFDTAGSRYAEGIGTIAVLMRAHGFVDESDWLDDICRIAARQGESADSIRSIALDHLFSVSRELYDQIAPPAQPDTLY